MKGTALVLFLLTAASTFTQADFWSETRDHTVETVRHPERTIRNAGRTIRNNPIGVAVNPGQLVNFTGIPLRAICRKSPSIGLRTWTTTFRHPENLMGAPLYAALNTARNRALSGRTHRIPPAVRAQLAPFFPPGRLEPRGALASWPVPARSGHAPACQPGLRKLRPWLHQCPPPARQTHRRLAEAAEF